MHAERKKVLQSSRILTRFLKKAGITTQLREIMSWTLQKIQEQARNAYKNYRKLCQSSDLQRQSWLESLASARANSALLKREHQGLKSRFDKLDVEAKQAKATEGEIRALMSRERSRKIFGRIRHSVGKENLSALSIISVPAGVDEQGVTQWKDISSHSEVVDALIKEHKKKYHQTSGSPPMTAPISRQIGLLGVGKEADKILAGQYMAQRGTDEFSAVLLQALKSVDEEGSSLRVGMSGQEFSAGWAKIKERTSSGGAVCHFGHCKALAQDSQLAEMEAAFVSIPLRTGHAYSYWKKGIDCVLPKKKHSNKIDALRTIVLLEASFNFTSKTLSRKVAAQAELQNGFAEEQFGSRKDHRAIDHALNKRVTLDLLRQFKMPGVLRPNDLKSCYDRICHNIASLCMRRQGLAESESVCMFSTLQHLEHTIRCAYGDSTKTYGNELWAVPMQGVLQGNGAGPVIWAVVSSPILQIMRAKGYGTFFKASISGSEIRLVGYAFVDDTDLMQTARNWDENIESVIKEMQNALNLWEGLIKATGGALSVEKCCWWAIDFHWNADGTWRYKKAEEITGSLHAKDSNNHIQTITRLEVSEAFETLGVFLAPDGNQTSQIKKLTDKASQWADRISTSHLRDQETLAALKTTILKTIEYPLLTLHLSREQLRKIMSPVLIGALPKTKFNRNFCRKTLFGPSSHLGLELHQVFTTQVIDHIDGFLRHATQETLTGKLIRGSLEAVKVEIGLPGHLFANKFQEVGHLATDCWIKDTWRELEQENILLYEHTPSLQLSRVNDQFIMVRFCQVGFKNIQLTRLNRCRIFLQVFAKSCICSGDGKYLLPGMAEGINHWKGTSNITWPHQGQLPMATWRLWRRALRKAFPHDRGIFRGPPLGQWTTQTPLSWPAHHCPHYQITYIKHDKQWRRFQHHPLTNAEGVVVRPPPI